MAADFEKFPHPDGRYSLRDLLGRGAYGKCYCASDAQAENKSVAIKIQKLEDRKFIENEYEILSNRSAHANLIDFYGVFKKEDEIWFVLELCEGGTVLDLVNGLLARNRRMAEEHIACVLKETVKALMHLHQNHAIHRDVRASNILLTKDGEIKLADFNFSSTTDKATLCLGSPSWMAPEMISGGEYDNKIDVWALGITAIELGDGKAPYQNMHPTRIKFQIGRNPPPTLYRPQNWTELYNDFVDECLIKNPEHRPFAEELLEHPFLAELPANNNHLAQEIKSLFREVNQTEKNSRPEEIAVISNFIKKRDESLEWMYVEDLAALEVIDEKIILQTLEMRMEKGQFHHYLGDVLLVLNPNEHKNIYGSEVHQRYNLKSRSDNSPHIYAVADNAYQTAIHHESTQYILLAGESGSGKTTNYLHAIDHLLFLGHNQNINMARIKNGVAIVQALIEAGTPINSQSTRAVLSAEFAFGSSGKISGAIFSVMQLEKWRISSGDPTQLNFRFVYNFYRGMEASEKLEKYNLKYGADYAYLRRPDNDSASPDQLKKMMEIFEEFEFGEEERETVWKVLAAVLNLGNIRFYEGEDGKAAVKNSDSIGKIAELLDVNDQKLKWALTNYCLVKQSSAVRKKYNLEQARTARDVLANTLYTRMVDYIVAHLNHKLSYGRAIFGQKYTIKLLDIPGFECFKTNGLSQVFVNCLNEQLYYHYVQRIFALESLELEEMVNDFNYYNNMAVLDQVFTKPGLLSLIDEASRTHQNGNYINEYLSEQQKSHVSVLGSSEFSIAHYTGTVTYSSEDLPKLNRDFLPPDLIETMRQSSNSTIKNFFSNKLNQVGTLCLDEGKKLNKSYSQIKKMRTLTSVYKSSSLALLKELGVMTNGIHFVRCIRTDLRGQPGGFNKELIRQQLRSLAVLETAKIQQEGFPCRIEFSEFLRRYKFLAFDFNEYIEISKDNCRLLLIRLKMEGWSIGKTKVFLKYYNEEYLARLYETQVKKIIKMQCMIRSYLVRRKIAREMKKTADAPKIQEMTEEEAAVTIQKAYRGFQVRKTTQPSQQNEQLDERTVKIMETYFKKWRNKTIFQTLLLYRAARYQDLFNLSQQVHLFNQNALNTLLQFNDRVGDESIDLSAQANVSIGEAKPVILKLPFRLDEIPYYDTSHMCDITTGSVTDDEESWNAMFQKKLILSNESSFTDQINSAYSRDPSQPIIISSEYDETPEDDEPPEDGGKTPEDDGDNVELPLSKSDSRKDSLNSENETIQSANQDFEFIKPTRMYQKKLPNEVNPIAELERLGRRNSLKSEDDPPYNFQAMLRKTNYNRDLPKVVERPSIYVKNKQVPKRSSSADVSLDSEDNNELKRSKSTSAIGGELISTELLPGVFIEGVIVDL